MRRIAIINQKGGVGKTTTTVNLGAAIARANKKTLLIDLDPQGHLSLHYGHEVKAGSQSVYDVLVDSVKVADVAVKIRKNMTLIPADIDLAAAEAELLGVVGREVILRESVNAYNDRHDFLLIDCPPSLGVLTINALVASDEVIIPLQAHFFALQGLGKLLDTVTLVRQRINPKLRVSGIILCMYEASTKLATEIVEDLTMFLNGARGTDVAWADAIIYQARIRRNIKLAEAASFGKTVLEYDPKSNGALDYETLAQEVLAQDAASIDASSMAAPASNAIKPKRTRQQPSPIDLSKNHIEPETLHDDANSIRLVPDVVRGKSDKTKNLPNKTQSAGRTTRPQADNSTPASGRPMAIENPMKPNRETQELVAAVEPSTSVAAAS